MGLVEGRVAHLSQQLLDVFPHTTDFIFHFAQQGRHRPPLIHKQADKTARLGRGQRLAQVRHGRGLLPLRPIRQRQQNQPLQPFICPLLGRHFGQPRLQNGDGHLWTTLCQSHPRSAERHSVALRQLLGRRHLPLCQQNLDLHGRHLIHLLGKIVLASRLAGLRGQHGRPGHIPLRQLELRQKQFTSHKPIRVFDLAGEGQTLFPILGGHRQVVPLVMEPRQAEIGIANGGRGGFARDGDGALIGFGREVKLVFHLLYVPQAAR